MSNKLLEIISKEKLEDLLLNRLITPGGIAHIYKCDRITVVKAINISHIDLSDEWKKRSRNNLLKLITPEELKRELFELYSSPHSIAEKYKVNVKSVHIAINRCNIYLDPDIWKKQHGIEHRRLLLTKVTLNKEQQAIINGSLLGDGGMTKPYGNQQSSFQYSQSYAHKEYIEWFHSYLSPFCLDLKEYKHTLASTTKVHNGYFFNTIKCPEISKYRKLFYPNGKKIVPSSITNLLTELSLAIWYMDDGTNNSTGRNSVLCTNGFTSSDVELLIGVLYNKFNVKSHLIYQDSTNNKYPMIRIGAREGYTNFHDIVDPIVTQFSCFKHKLAKVSTLHFRKGEQCLVSKLTNDQVIEIRKLYKEGISKKELSVKFKVVPLTVNNIVTRKNWKHLPEEDMLEILPKGD